MSGHRKVEVVNNTSERKPLYETDKTICGLIFNKKKIYQAKLPQFDRNDIQEISKFLTNTLGVE